MSMNLNVDQLRQQMQENFKKGLEYHQEQNHQKAVEYLQKALGTCEIIGDSDLKAEILFVLGNTYQLRDSAQDFQLAEECYQELLSMEGKKQQYYTRVQIKRAVAFVNRGDYEKGVKLFNEIHSLEDEMTYLDEWTTETYAYFCLGKFTDSAYFQEAIKHCEKIISMGQKDKNSKALFYAHHNLGHIYYELGENIKSILSFQDSMEFAPERYQRYETYVDIALVFIRLSQYDLAKAYIDRAQHFFEKSKQILGLAACLFAKGKLYRQKGRIEEAANYLELALSGYREKEYYYGVVKTFYELYELYRKQSPEKAELYYDQYQFYMNYVSPMGVERVDCTDEEDDPNWV